MVTRSADELSIVAPVSQLEGHDTVEAPWTAFKVEGPLDFSLVGIMAELSNILAGAKISLFAISTYDTDYILVGSQEADQAQAAFEAAGHIVT